MSRLEKGVLSLGCPLKRETTVVVFFGHWKDGLWGECHPSDIYCLTYNHFLLSSDTELSKFLSESKKVPHNVQWLEKCRKALCNVLTSRPEYCRGTSMILCFHTYRLYHCRHFQCIQDDCHLNVKLVLNHTFCSWIF